MCVVDASLKRGDGGRSQSYRQLRADRAEKKTSDCTFPSQPPIAVPLSVPFSCTGAVLSISIRLVTDLTESKTVLLNIAGIMDLLSTTPFRDQSHRVSVCKNRDVEAQGVRARVGVLSRVENWSAPPLNRRLRQRCLGIRLRTVATDPTEKTSTRALSGWRGLVVLTS